MSESSPSVAALFDLLSHRRRRLIVLCVAGAPETGIPLRTLAETMYAFENDETPTTASTRSVTNLKTTISRSHIPHLRDMGCVTQDEADRLHPGPQLAWAVAVIAVGMLGVDH
jgi:hypothetical protein